MADYLSQGVFIEERNAGARPISGVATATLGIVGIFSKGSVDDAVGFTSYEEFASKLGDLLLTSDSAYSVKAFFDNGGASGYAARAIYATDAAAAELQIAESLAIGAAVTGDAGHTAGQVTLTAATKNLKITVDGKVIDNLDVTAGGGAGTYSLTVICSNINKAFRAAYGSTYANVASVVAAWAVGTPSGVVGSPDTVFSGTLTTPVVPRVGSNTNPHQVKIQESGGQYVVDDGVGNLSGDGTGTIDYETGAFTINFEASCGAGTGTGSYSYEVAGSYSLRITSPTVGTSSYVKAEAATANSGFTVIYGVATIVDDTGVAASATKTFKYSAASVGVWGDDITVTHTVNGDQADRIDLRVAIDGVTTEFYEALSYNKADAELSYYYKTVIENSSQNLVITEDAGWVAGVGLPVSAIGSAIPLTGGYEKLSETATYGARATDMQTSFGNAIELFDSVDEILSIIVPDAETLPAANCAIIQNIAGDYHASAERHNDTFAIVGTPSDKDNSDASTVANYLSLTASGLGAHSFAAMYYPAVNIYDELRSKNRRISVSGHVAGIYARTDSTRNVGKAPGGITDGALRGIVSVYKRLSKGERDILYPRRINPIISSADTGNCVWGVRTTSIDSLWRYIQNRRLFMFCERSVYKSLFWVVDENNGPDLWLKSSVQIGAFMYNLWLNGYFAGSTPAESYQVIADATNNPQSQIDAGLFTLDVDIAPNKPAEFVRVRFQQKVKNAA